MSLFDQVIIVGGGVIVAFVFLYGLIVLKTELRARRDIDLTINNSGNHEVEKKTASYFRSEIKRIEAENQALTSALNMSDIACLKVYPNNAMEYLNLACGTIMGHMPTAAAQGNNESFRCEDESGNQIPFHSLPGPRSIRECQVIAEERYRLFNRFHPKGVDIYVSASPVFDGPNVLYSLVTVKRDSSDIGEYKNVFKQID